MIESLTRIFNNEYIILFLIVFFIISLLSSINKN
jgi:hypothetical protein